MSGISDNRSSSLADRFPATAPGLELRNLSGVRGGRPLFRGVQARIAPGQLLKVQGPNGAGKTSLLRMICGLSVPSEGDVMWDGASIATLRETFGAVLIYVGHAAALKDDLSAQDNLISACAIGGLAITTAQAADALLQAGLGGRGHLPARVLSQGQRRRVSLARLALGRASRLWVLDEPFNALDTAATAWLLSLLAAQLGAGGIVVLTSHQRVALDFAPDHAVVSL